MMRRLLLVAALLISAGPAIAACDDACLSEIRREQAEARIATFDEDAFRVADAGHGLQLVSYGFDKMSMRAVTYSGRDVGVLDYPAIGGFAWLVRLDPDWQGDVYQVRQVLNQRAGAEPGRYLMTPDVLLDVEEGIELRIKSRIRFFAEHRDLFPDSERVRLVISAPFWKQEEYGEAPLGLIKTRTGGQQQGYLDFSARHLLCFGDRGTDLIDADWMLDRLGGEASTAEMTIAMEREVRSRCEAAVQVGPTFIERRRGSETNLQYGISGASIREAARNIFMAVAGTDGSSETYIVSTPSSIGSFDMMVVLDRIAALALDGREILWAVGIQDEELLSGPLILENGRAISLNSIDNPAGALVVFREPE